MITLIGSQYNLNFISENAEKHDSQGIFSTPVNEERSQRKRDRSPSSDGWCFF